MADKKMELSPLQERIHEIIFEADTREGRIFDVVLMVAILASVIVVMLESVPTYSTTFHNIFVVLEWIFTAFFTIEYILRLYCVYKPRKYATSFFGIIDLVSILPTFLSILIPGTQSLMVIRALRLLRIFRIFKLANFLSQGQLIIRALKESRDKIVVFMMFILLMVCIFGSLMYLIEGQQANSGFDSIPRSVYWAIVTLTTVGYGDISPVTSLGQLIASVIMITGYAVIAVPTGIVTGEVINAARWEKESHRKAAINTQHCKHCSREGHDGDAVFCKYCGERLNN